MGRFLSWLFEAPPEMRTAWSIVKWWEARRLAYNVIVGVVGFVSLIIFMLVMSAPGILKPGEDAVEPMAIFFAPILINIAYTLGWILEIPCNWLRRQGSGRTGPALLAIGFCFSLLLMLLPLLASVMSLLALHRH
ncbi:MAG: hypothetical protein JWQ02_839 [Capsulimonas sp.]|nr:hypothetical protein [Capsulimonas sp.]